MDDARKIIAEPPGLDFRTASLTIRTRSWTGGGNGAEIRLGTSTDSDLLLVPRPKMKEQDGGNLLVGPITPSYAGGGYTVAQLNPLVAATAGQEILYVVTGPAGTHTYALLSIDTTKSLRYMLTLTPLDRSVPQ